MTSPTDFSIRTADVRVTRGGREVLHGVDVSVRAGEIVGLLGPSGCGKTTLMRAIVGVQAKVTGTIVVLGRPAGDPALRREVGYVTQAPSVYGDLSVLENLRYFAAVVGVGADRCEWALRTVDLSTFGDRVVSTLSGGERTRVSLATALLGNPQVLVLDEPTVGLDPVLRRDIWNQMRTLAERGAALLVSSHVMDEAERCDRLVLMRDGAVIAAGTQEELLSRTQTRDVESAFLALVEAAAPQ
ncbi:MAG: ABC transporter ATP-binding protein [Anaerolineaceae bacterium]